MKTLKRKLRRKNAAVSAVLLSNKYFDNPVTDGSEPTEKSVIAGKHNADHGRYSNMTIQPFQHWLFECNVSDHLTDVELSNILTREFPRSKCVINHGGFPVHYLVGMRTQINSGTHAGQNGQRPDHVSPQFNPDRTINTGWKKRWDALEKKRADAKKRANAKTNK